MNAVAYHQSEAIRLASAGRLVDALAHFEQVCRLDPSNPAGHFNSGCALQNLNRLLEAAQAYHRAIQLAPDFFDAWNNLSAALKASGQIEAAVAAGKRAVELRPNIASGFLNLGNALKAHGDWPGAETAYRRAVALEPRNPRNQLNLANTLRELGRLDEALPHFRNAVRTNPDFAEAHRDLAFALFLTGDLASGWPENEWRWRTPELARKRREFNQPAWTGEPIRGKRLLVYTEQGYGDAIQFVRFAECVAEQGAEVILECQQTLARLFASAPGVAKLIVRGSDLPAFDYHIPLLSLPNLFKTNLDTIPRRIPYLAAPPGGPKLQSHSQRRRIGLVWAGNPGHLNDQNRSLPFQLLQPLLRSVSADFFSLQIGDRARDLSTVPASLTDCSPSITDYADTAAVVQQLDLVISVDTSVAHLAGALGKPIWLLLPFAPDWRWLLQRTDSPWYPTMRLFRQPAPGDWPSVIASVIAAL